MNHEPILIGVAGRAHSGKDPAAQVIAGHMDGPTAIIPLATGLKQMLAAHYGLAWGGVQAQALLYTAQGKAQPSPNPLKAGNSVRQDLIDLGDATRALDPDIWVRDLRRRALASEAKYVLVPDVRYPNELQAMDCGIWVGPDDAGEHPTESALTSADFTRHARYMQSTVEGRLSAIRGVFRIRRGDDWTPEWEELWVTDAHKGRQECEKEKAKYREREERLDYLLRTKPTGVEYDNREFEVRYEKSDDDTQARIYEQDKLVATAGVFHALIDGTFVELPDPNLFSRPVQLVRELVKHLPVKKEEVYTTPELPEPRFEDQAQVDATLPPAPYPFGPWQDLGGTRPWSDTGHRLSDGHTATLYWYRGTHQLVLENADGEQVVHDLMGGDEDPANWARAKLAMYLLDNRARVLDPVKSESLTAAEVRDLDPEAGICVPRPPDLRPPFTPFTSAYTTCMWFCHTGDALSDGYTVRVVHGARIYKVLLQDAHHTVDVCTACTREAVYEQLDAWAARYHFQVREPNDRPGLDHGKHLIPEPK
jgi:hypothetical protein